MTTQSDKQTVVSPHHEAQDIPSHVSSLTRRDLDAFLDMLSISPLSDWQWRVLVGLGILAEQERVAAEFRAAATPRPIVVPAGFESTEYFPEFVSDGPAHYWARDYPFGYELSSAKGNKVTRWSRQDRDGRAIWVQMP